MFLFKFNFLILLLLSVKIVIVLLALMVELVDAKDLKSFNHNDCTGSNPVKGTIHFHNEYCLSVSLKATDSNISSLFK